MFTDAKNVELYLHKYMAEFHRASDGNSFLFYVDRKGCRIQDVLGQCIKVHQKVWCTSKKKQCPDVPEHLYVHMFRHSKGPCIFEEWDANASIVRMAQAWLRGNND